MSALSCPTWSKTTEWSNVRFSDKKQIGAYLMISGKIHCKFYLEKGALLQ